MSTVCGTPLTITMARAMVGVRTDANTFTPNKHFSANAAFSGLRRSRVNIQMVDTRNTPKMKKDQASAIGLERRALTSWLSCAPGPTTGKTMTARTQLNVATLISLLKRSLRRINHKMNMLDSKMADMETGVYKLTGPYMGATVNSPPVAA
mmetsp:Transcript_21539/g.28346  ORF Transcript_21539/g.28346 Transcript_21539/m.28346 type:complete len:151 (+) Transcript_21539:532-984(+)